MIETMIEEKKDVRSYLEAAHNIGKHLSREAIWIEDKCNWIGHEVTLVDGQHANAVRSCGIEFYSGLSGIALFLSELYHITKDPIILHTLEGTLNNIFYNLESNNLNNYGYYSGKVGLGFTLWRIGLKLEREELSAKGLEIVKSIKDEALQRTEIDIISGAAGAISILLKLYFALNDQEFLDMAKKCGEFLLSIAIEENNTFSWKTVDDNYALTGFSHGASGIAVSLLELYDTTKEEKYWNASMGGFRFEQTWYNEKEQNWPDSREFNGQGTPQCMSMWCHGAPGIAIAHMKAYELTQHDYFLGMAKVALGTTFKSVLNDIRNNPGMNFSICHGLAGNSDILLVGSDVFNDPQYRSAAYSAGDLGIQRYDKTRTIYPSGVNDPSRKTMGQQENAGLMLGLSGTGMFYLRLYNSRAIPSVLIP